MSEHVYDQQDVERAAAARDHCRIAALEAALLDYGVHRGRCPDDDGDCHCGLEAALNNEPNDTAALDAMLERAVREGMEAGVADFRGMDRDDILTIVKKVKECG